MPNNQIILKANDALSQQQAVMMKVKKTAETLCGFIIGIDYPVVRSLDNIQLQEGLAEKVVVFHKIGDMDIFKERGYTKRAMGSLIEVSFDDIEEIEEMKPA